MRQDQGDVLLFQTTDDGEIEVEDGHVTLSGGLETAAYLSLFGGNEQDSGRPDDPLTWWGNIDEQQPERQYRSETQYLLQSIPAVPANLRRIEQAAQRDLAWFVTVGAATEVSAVATMPAVNRVRLVIQITANGIPTTIEYIENWKADAA
jgi:phage gp46-like protein